MRTVFSTQECLQVLIIFVKFCPVRIELNEGVPIPCTPHKPSQPGTHDAVESVGPALERAGHKLNVWLAVSNPQVVGDRIRLIQVLANLLRNTCKFTPGGDRLITRL